MNAHDHLQDALARLEKGEALEHVLPTVAQDEADLLRMAAALQTAAQVAPDEKKHTTQRAALLRTANATIRQPNRPILQHRGWIAALAGAAAMLGVCGVFLLAGSLLWRQATTAKSSAPGNTARLAPNPQTAVLDHALGAVEITAADNQWGSADGGALLKAGQSVRTQALSSVTVIFYDGSRVTLGPNTDITVNALDAGRTGRRTVQLSQTAGTSTHRVAKSPTIDSIYEVTTPSGAGRAKGTEFQVTVSANQVARFDVSEGAVTVVNANTTVLVAAGQSTTVSGQQPPAAPVSYFSGAGELQSMGAVWVIAGQAMLVNDDTVIEGDPRVGDWVSFEGRTQHNGSRFADRITLIHRALINTFSFVGAVEAMGTTTWTVSGRTVQIEAQTQIDDGLAAGDAVEVTGRLAEDGSFVAETIQRLAPTSEAAFDFTGVVESIGTEVWAISGLTVTVNLSTTIAPDLAVNDVVRVTGTIQADGTWQAAAIDKAGETGAFDFSGVVISTTPWNVSGAPFETDAHTVIDEGIRVGNRVRVQGQVLPDGTWLADRITQIDQGQRHAVQFTALVQSIAPWVIGNVTVTVDSKTKIIGSIDTGDLVTVKGNLLPDGTVIAKSITRVSQTEPTATPTPTATPEITPTLTLTPTLTPTPTVTPEGTPTTVSGESVTLCHIPPGNPNNAKTITVGQGAVAAHLAHGDTLGPCPPTSPSKKKP